MSRAARCALLDAFATGGAAADEKRDFLDHLGTCPNCQRELPELLLLDDLLFQHGPRMGLESSGAKIIVAVRPKPRPKNRWRCFAAIAAVVLLLSGAASGVVFWTGTQDRSTSDECERKTLADLARVLELFEIAAEQEPDLREAAKHANRTRQEISKFMMNH